MDVVPILKIYKVIDKFLFVKSGKININDTILLSGTPRSGSTWLMEVMVSIPGYTYLFEPLNPIYAPECFEVGFRSRTYIPYDKDWPEGEKYISDVFNGRVFSLLPQYHFKPEMMIGRLLADKLVVKAIRMNRMLPWISRKFKLRRIIFLIRHPCSVIASQLKTGVTGYHYLSPPYLDAFPSANQILEEVYKIDILNENIINTLKKINTPEEILAAAWCLDNYIPLTFKRPYPWFTVIYEKLVKDSEREVARILNGAGIKEIPKSTLSKLKTPSMLAIGSDRKTVGETNKQLSKWKEYLSEKQVERILKIVSDFELDFYTDKIEPDYDHPYLKN